MIISNNHKYLYIANPKTGTRTAFQLLTPYGISLNGEHLTIRMALGNAGRLIPEFNMNQIEGIFVFWRDPVQRFISAVNHFRSPRGIHVLIRHHKEWFDGIDLSMYPAPTPGVAPTLITVTAEMLSAAASITPEMMFQNEELRTHSALLSKQSKWITPHEKLMVLNFDDFENNMRTVATAFGANLSDIPVVNASNKITTSLSAELEASIREYYAEDYILKP
jgi:hypothetical protein